MSYLFEPQIDDPRLTGQPISLEFDTAAGRRATFEDVFATNPIPSMINSAKANAARGLRQAPGSHLFVDFEEILEPDGSGEFRGKKFLSIDEQADIIEQNNLTDHLEPQFGETEESLNIIIAAKRAEITRKFIAANSGIGLTGQITVGLLASAFDPINLGAAFVPVVGQARYAAMLGSQASKFGRAAVRARVGATEGAVGALAIEPLVYSSLQNVQADYDLYDSFANLAFGAGLGAGLRSSGGFIGDIINNSRAKQSERQMAELTLEAGVDAHADIVRTSVGQLMSGRRVVGADVTLRTALENSTAVGRIIDQTIPMQQLDDIQPLIARGDYLLETSEAGGVQKVPAIRINVATGGERSFAAEIKNLEANGLDARVERSESAAPPASDNFSLSTLVSKDALAQDEFGQFLSFATKKAASKARTRLKKSGDISDGEAVKIGDAYYIAKTDDPVALNLIKKHSDSIVLPEYLPPALGRLSIGDDGVPHWSPDQDYTASKIREANSPEGELFYGIEQQMQRMADDLDVTSEITPEAIALEIDSVRSEIERSGSAEDLADFNKRQAAAQKELDDLNEQEAAVKDAFACAAAGLTV